MADSIKNGNQKSAVKEDYISKVKLHVSAEREEKGIYTVLTLTSKE